jgi:hypothetical protein
MRLTVTPATYAFIAVLGLVITAVLFKQEQAITTPNGVDYAGAVAVDVGSHRSARRAIETVTPTPTPEPPPPPSSILRQFRIVSFYGHPFSAIMGVIGEGSVDEIARRLRQQADGYAAADPTRPVKPAFHFIYSVAQASAGADGLYLYRTDDAVVRPYIDYARQNDMLIFLDLQNGRSDVAAEVQHVLPYLREPHVHLALDPEFTMPAGEVPGVHIGHLNAAQINRAQEILQEFILEHRLPNKVLMVHQFQDDMVDGREIVQDFDRVDLVFDMDGWGAPEAKTTKYHRFAVTPPSDFAAIKLFYKWDVPVLTPATILSLDPKPDIIIYQ